MSQFGQRVAPEFILRRQEATRKVLSNCNKQKCKQLAVQYQVAPRAAADELRNARSYL